MMTAWERYQRDREIAYRMEGQPECEVIEADLCDISGRLRDYDPAFFLVRNHSKAAWEVHCLGNRGDTYVFTVPFKTLDQRTLNKVSEVDRKRRGWKALMRERQEANELNQKRKDNQWKDDCHQIAKEVRSAFKQAALYA